MLLLLWSVGERHDATAACPLTTTVELHLQVEFTQYAIAAYLYYETANLDQMLKKVEAAIERLQEYRTALITSAVTGKIDVRGIAE